MSYVIPCDSLGIMSGLDLCTHSYGMYDHHALPIDFGALTLNLDVVLSWSVSFSDDSDSMYFTLHAWNTVIVHNKCSRCESSLRRDSPICNVPGVRRWLCERWEAVHVLWYNSWYVLGNKSSRGWATKLWCVNATKLDIRCNIQIPSRDVVCLQSLDG